jgi:hypothetical protein
MEGYDCAYSSKKVKIVNCSDFFFENFDIDTFSNYKEKAYFFLAKSVKKVRQISNCDQNKNNCFIPKMK